MLQKIKKFCQEEQLLEQGCRVVVGVSGGADSVCLLRVLCLLREERQLLIQAVHIHHGIRADEADADMDYVKALCQAWDVPFRVFCEDVPQIAQRQHMSLEEAGRAVRYQAFENVRQELGYDTVAVAHHMDDLAETVLMNMARGSGIRGAAGTRPARDKIIRPLLCVRRLEIEQWLTKQGILWRNDSTNQEDLYFRNRVRHWMIPQLEQFGNTRAVEHIAEFAADLQETDAYFIKEAERILAEDILRTKQEQNIRYEVYKCLTPSSAALSCEILKTQPRILSAYLIRQLISGLHGGLRDITRMHIDQIIALAWRNGGKEIMLPDGIRVYLEYDRVIFERHNETMAESDFSIAIRIFLADFTKKVPQNCCINWFDYDKIDRSIQLRCRRSGDRICVKTGGASKKLKDYLIDAKMPLRVRDKWPMLAAGSRILWIPGYRMDEDVKVTQETKVIMEAELILHR